MEAGQEQEGLSVEKQPSERWGVGEWQKMNLQSGLESGECLLPVL